MDLFDGATISYTQARQGGAGTCYIMATMAASAEFPDLIKNIFITPTKNSAGIIGLRLYIRGRPWVVSIDDYLLFRLANTLKFAYPSTNLKAIWGAVLEKAWAKVKGNYLNAEGGLNQNGLRSFIGYPVFSYMTSAITNTADTFTMIKAADNLKYVMAASTSGSGNDQQTNSCGIAMSHAYSMIAAFQMTDA